MLETMYYQDFQLYCAPSKIYFGPIVLFDFVYDGSISEEPQSDYSEVGADIVCELLVSNCFFLKIPAEATQVINNTEMA